MARTGKFFQFKEEFFGQEIQGAIVFLEEEVILGEEEKEARSRKTYPSKDGGDRKTHSNQGIRLGVKALLKLSVHQRKIVTYYLESNIE